MLSAWWIFDFNFKFLELINVALQEMDVKSWV